LMSTSPRYIIKATIHDTNPMIVFVYHALFLYRFLYQVKNDVTFCLHHCRIFFNLFIINYDFVQMYKNSLIRYIVCYIIYDFFSIMGLKPYYGIIAFKPRLLLSAVTACVALNSAYSFV